MREKGVAGVIVAVVEVVADIQGFIYWGVWGGSFPPKPSNFPPKIFGILLFN